MPAAIIFKVLECSETQGLGLLNVSKYNVGKHSLSCYISFSAFLDFSEECLSLPEPEFNEGLMTIPGIRACQTLLVCVFITAVPNTKLFAWGEEDSGGHVL
jgi:hypothetical protein